MYMQGNGHDFQSRGVWSLRSGISSVNIVPPAPSVSTSLVYTIFCSQEYTVASCLPRPRMGTNPMTKKLIFVTHRVSNGENSWCIQKFSLANESDMNRFHYRFALSNLLLIIHTGRIPEIIPKGLKWFTSRGRRELVGKERICQRWPDWRFSSLIGLVSLTLCELFRWVGVRLLGWF